MESVKQFIEASERRSALVARLRGMLEASVPLPPESPATPKSELNFAKGFPEPAEDDEYPAYWEYLYKELWNPEPEGDGTETNGAQIFVSLVDQEDPSEHPESLDPSEPAYLYSNWKFILEQLKKGEERTFRNWVRMYPHNANNYDKARPEGSEDPVPHLDKAMAEFNTAMIMMGATDLDYHYVTHAIRTSTGEGSAIWHFKRALANLEDYGEVGGGASARYAAQKSEMRKVIEHRLKEHLEANEVAWQSNAQRARDAAGAAAASDATGDELAAVWADVEDCWTIAIAAKNGAKESDFGALDDWDFSGPEGEECEKGIAEAVAKQKAARESAK